MTLGRSETIHDNCRDVSELEYILELKGKDILKMSPEMQEMIKEDAFTYWMEHGFPYPERKDGMFKKEYERLAKLSPRDVIKNNNIVKLNPTGLQLANYFHPQIWEIRVKDAYSPMDRFEDARILKKIIDKSISIWPERRVYNNTYLRNAIRVYSKTRSVTNFRPAVAKAIIETYSGDHDPVLDFCAGFGGRLLGCASLKRHYYGVDPALEQYLGNRELLKYCRDRMQLECTATLKKDMAETHLEQLESGSFSLAFSSPPYFDYEQYGSEVTQSHIRFPNYEDWKNGFLKKIVNESHRIIHSKGYLVLHIKNVRNYPLEEDFMAIAKRKFQLKKILQLQTVSRPYRTNESKKFEPILIFKKT
ncbi:hypothetical protein AB9K32_07765 [Allomuricauda sp. XS_ASV26]|uniref:hypothetical protein n=1 Tax=Allomuricauda sp. XS_ASV26 TaxID=3241292 RepID=UPI0035163AB5